MSGASVDLNGLNHLLGAGVRLLRYSLEAEGPRFAVTLTLEDKAGAQHELLFGDVQNLELVPDGDALLKPMRLHLDDLRGDGLDRVRFSLEELDRDTLFLHCAELWMEGLRLEP